MASGDTLYVWDAMGSDPGDKLNTATIDRRGDMPVLDFDDSTKEFTNFHGIMPSSYSGLGVTVRIYWSATDTTVTTPDGVRWDAAFRWLELDVDDLDTSHSYAVNSVSDDEGTASGEIVGSAITFSDGIDMDDVDAGDIFILQISRDVSHGDDDLVDDAEVCRVEIEET